MLVSGRASASSVENFEASPSSQIVRVTLVREYSNTPPIAMAVPGTANCQTWVFFVDVSIKFNDCFWFP